MIFHARWRPRAGVPSLWLLAAAFCLPLPSQNGHCQAPVAENAENETGGTEVFLTECLDFIGGFALKPATEPEILHTALDLLIAELGDGYGDAKPAIKGRNRTEALFLFQKTLDDLASRPGQRLSRLSLAEHAIRLYLQTLDPYSRYRSPKEVERFERAITAPESGVGMEIQEDSGKLLCYPFPDSSAETAGIPLGGRLMTVDGASVEGKSLFELAGLIRGPEGTTVTLRIEHAFGRSKVYNAKRESLKTPMLLVDEALGNRVMIRIRKINPSTLKELKAFARDNAADFSTITLDLRSCPGGDLATAVAIADIFLPKGVPIGAAVGPQVRKEFRSTTSPLFTPRNLVILHNRGTASAAEFLIGALMSNQDALRVSMQGEETTYGKAIAQEARNLSSGGLIQLTTARLFLPDGTTWQDEGLKPNRFQQP